jgi:uncharacterized protein DUF2330
MRRTRAVAFTIVAAVTTVGALLALTSPAWACGSLVAANGAVDLEQSTTLAAYHDGVEHYVTSFEFAGTPKSFGSIVPLPARPSSVERAGSWTLQRLEREVKPPILEFEAKAASPTTAADGVEVIQKVQIDSLDVTILRGGGAAVAKWAQKQGFDLSKDAPGVLRFYSRRSPYFMAAKFDATAAAAKGFRGGDGIPVDITIPTREPWVPLRILSTAKPGNEIVKADVFLLTDRKPSLLHGAGFDVQRSETASTSLLDDLRSDKNSAWVPDQAWLTYARIETPAHNLNYDLAINATGGKPRVADTGVSSAAAIGLAVPGAGAANVDTSWAAWLVVGLAIAAMLAGVIALTGTGRIPSRVHRTRG